MAGGGLVTLTRLMTPPPRLRKENAGAGGGGCGGDCDSVAGWVIPRPEVLWTGEDELLDDTLDLTWSHTNSNSSTSSRESGEVDAYFRMVSIRVVMYRRFASVLERPEHDFHASLRFCVSK
jgi:hypothetical protein